MFTGLIEKIGKVTYIAGKKIRIDSGYNDLAAGESIAVDGVCLTVERIQGNEFTAHMSDETLHRSTCSSLKIGSPVHLERALCATGRMGGHMVQGHIDAMGEITAIGKDADNKTFEIVIPENLLKYVAVKGSITIDGISLTIVSIQGPRITIVMIPHSFASTHWKYKKIGSPVNIEADILAKYVERHLTAQKNGELFQKKELSLEALLSGGFE
ncbi:MAG: riboflavin synthase [bacterium]